MSAIEIATYLKYASLQMAAEATRLDEVKAGTLPLLTALTDGNNRSSKFTPDLATQFIADGWVVAAHQSNTGTGFSGTLFKNTLTNELVLSFRSTEFIDDAVRDSQATNDLEIKAGGFAIGQVADMENWFKVLNVDPALLQGKNFAVTGYSLGGHLATAFNILHETEGRITGTYTFNGAGVGRYNSNESLRGIYERFEQSRHDASAAFTNSTVLGLYNSVRGQLGSILNPTSADISIALTTTDAAVQAAFTAAFANDPATALAIRDQGKLLSDALTRIKTILLEAERIRDFQSGTSAPGPTAVVASQMDATELDYQIAVLISQRSTQSIGVLTGVFTRVIADFPIANVFDLYGEPWPSAVTNSQIHYGTATPIFIEDQPLRRGAIIDEVLARFGANWDIKLRTTSSPSTTSVTRIVWCSWLTRSACRARLPHSHLPPMWPH